MKKILHGMAAWYCSQKFGAEYKLMFNANDSKLIIFYKMSLWIGSFL